MVKKRTVATDERVRKLDLHPGDRVRVQSRGRTFEGVLMPRHAFSDASAVVLKLDNGYNVGLALAAEDELELVKRGAAPARAKPSLPPGAEGLPQVALLGTGGTIASFVEYRTGAVYPATTPEELAAAVPQAFDHARLVPRVVFEVFSEDLTPANWLQLGHAIVQAFDGGARGVVVTHGTDTMHFTAAALTCLFDELPGPVVLVGAQRSSDRPSSDAASNLVSAVRVAAQGGFGEVVLLMHADMSDDAWAIHAGGRARKMHSSRRDAFLSLNVPPIGLVRPDAIMWNVEPRAVGDRATLRGSFDAEVGLVWSYPGLRAQELKAAAGKGLVIAGTGLGHIPRRLIPEVAKLTKAGCVVAVATQCLSGATNLKVYETGRELLRAGCLDAGDMMPETAYVKLAWAVGTAQEPNTELLRAILANRFGRSEIDAVLERAASEKDRHRLVAALFATPRGRESAPRSGFQFPGGADRYG